MQIFVRRNKDVRPFAVFRTDKGVAASGGAKGTGGAAERFRFAIAIAAGAHQIPFVHELGEYTDNFRVLGVRAAFIQCADDVIRRADGLRGLQNQFAQNCLFCFCFHKIASFAEKHFSIVIIPDFQQRTYRLFGKNTKEIRAHKNGSVNTKP